MQPCVTVFGSARFDEGQRYYGAFEIATLMQTQKIEDLPLSDFARCAMIREGTLSPEDVRFVYVADTAAYVVRLIRENVQRLHSS